MGTPEQSQLKPLVSVVMPVLNEAAHMERTLESLLQQDTSRCDLEFLLIDGRSTDATPNIIESYQCRDARVVLVQNPRRKTPIAFNIGLRAAHGEYVAILGAHSEYANDYVGVCLEELLQHGAAGCSGTLATVPAGGTLGARLAAWCLAHRFASSGSSVRTQHSGFVETIPYPVFRKSALIAAGGYDEQLDRNQDNDMNQRLRALGHKLYLTTRTQALYHARSGVRDLVRYAFNTGRWNAFTLRRNWRAMSLRHFVPAGFLTALITLLLIACTAAAIGGPFKLPLAAALFLVALHLTLGLSAGTQTAVRNGSFTALLLAPVILGFHVSYGAGTLFGLAHRPVREGTCV